MMEERLEALEKAVREIKEKLAERAPTSVPEVNDAPKKN